ERRYVTVLFCDMTDSTTLSERLDPEEMDRLMDTIFSRFETVVREHEGTVEKYIGDALVAVFGVPTIHEDDPQRAVNAALQLQDVVTALNAELHSSGGLSGGISGTGTAGAERSRADSRPVVSFRIGIHTGLITTGRRGEYDVVTGHAMHVAARLQSQAPDGGILVSEETRLRAEQDFLYGEPQDFRLKGSSDRIRAWRVLGREANPIFSEGEFVGRENQIAAVTRSILKHDGSEAGGVLLTGPAGIGKTRMVGRIVEQLHGFPDFDSPVLTARARMYRSIHFSVIVDLLLTYFDGEPTNSVAELTRRVTSKLRLDNGLAEKFARLTHDPKAGMGENQAFTVLFEVFSAIVKKQEAAPYPLIIVIDNVQYTDPQSRGFLEFLLTNTSPKPFFLLTARDDSDLPTGKLAAVRSVTVPPLSSDQSETLFKKLWPDCRSKELMRTILANSLGNPLFLREYVRYAKQAERELANDRTHHGARFGGSHERANGEHIPSTIQTILLSSIDYLPAERRDLLKKLSAFKQFCTREDARFIEERTGGQPGEVDAAIDHFISQDFLVDNDGLLSFRHDVFKQTLYDSMLNHNKKVLHTVIAELMMQQEHPHTERLLHHLSRGGKLDAVADIIEDAEDTPIAPEYIPYIDELLADPGLLDERRTLNFLFLKSAIHFNTGNILESDRIVNQMLEVAMNEHRVDYAARAFHLMTGHHLERYEFSKAQLCGERAIAHYANLVSSDTIGPEDWKNRAGNVYDLMAIAAGLAGDESKARELIRSIGHVSGEDRSATAVTRSRTNLLFGRYRQAYEDLKPYLEEDVSRLYRRNEIIYPAMMASWQLCDFERMRELLVRLDMDRSSQTAYVSQIYSARAIAEYMLGDTQVERWLQRAEFYMLQLKNDFGQLDALRTLAIASIVIGQPDRAEHFAREGAAIGLRHSAFYPGFSCLIVAAELLAERSENASASFFLNEADTFVQTGATLPRRDLILYHYYRGSEPDGSETHLQRAAELLELERQELGDTVRYERLLSMRGFQDVHDRVVEGGWLPIENGSAFGHSGNGRSSPLRSPQA
ncbi:MAG: adenylate/guanylate cyclase domain-containing protein, partial [Spirochaetales bacterium]